MSHKIIVEGISKKFRLQADRPTSVKEIFTRRKRDKSLDEFWALRDVSLEIPEGSMYALIGHNGSGKSTMLRCIAGIYEPDGGRVRVEGRISTLLELGAGFHPDLSGRENIYMNATMLGMSKKSITKVFDDIVSFAGVERFIDSPVKVYSTGMYVRLGFSVAVHVDPEILIIDEVIAVGDEEFQRRCFEHLYALRRKGVTIVVVTHGMGLVETMCDGATWLDHGRLVASGEAPLVASQYLKRVNVREQEARSSAHIDEATPGDNAVPAQAASVLRLRGVRFEGPGGEELTSSVAGQPMAIALDYEALEPVDEPVFGVAVHATGGGYVTGVNTKLSEFSTGTVRGPGTVRLVMDSLLLNPGEYLLSIGITDRQIQHFYENRYQEWRLLVRAGDAIPGHGLVQLPVRWSLERTDVRLG